MFEDVTGKQLEAKTVYALSFKYLKDDMIDCLKKLGCDVNEDSIHWVFTVPAISNDAAKQLMIDVIVEVLLF
jgi:phenylalanyl-tRNA synthetase beta subunit